MNNDNGKEKSISWLEEYAWRLTWWIVCPLLLVISIIYVINADLRAVSDTLSYWGFVITLLAMVITICEVLCSMKRTSKISKEIEKRTIQIEKTANALAVEKEIMSVSECSVMVDNVISMINESRYDVAILLIHEIRKALCKTKRKDLLQKKIENVLSQNNEENDFSDMEKKIESYRTSSQGSGRVAKHQKTAAKQFFIEFRNVLDGLK